MYITDLFEDDLELSIKVVIVGNGAVGKSSMIQRYCRGIFTQSYKKTIGVDFLEKQLRIMSEDIRLMLWDTAGQEEFDAITKAYYRGAQACVVAFSTTDRASFDAVKKWKHKVEDECGHVPMVLVQNKIDLLHESQVSRDEVERLAKELQMRLYRTSVKEDLNVGNIFQHLAENYVAKVKAFNSQPDPFCDHLLQIGQSARHPPLAIAATANNNSFHNQSLMSYNNGYSRNQQNNRKQNRTTDPRYRCHPSVLPKQPSYYSHWSNSPQDYLKNPMFDSLHHHKKYWPSVDRTITLRPLGSFTNSRKNGHNKRPINKNSCRVL